MFKHIIFSPGLAKDAYAVLGLEENAEQSEIKKKYRKMSVQNHPDKGGRSPRSSMRFAKRTKSCLIRKNASTTVWAARYSSKTLKPTTSRWKAR